MISSLTSLCFARLSLAEFDFLESQLVTPVPWDVLLKSSFSTLYCPENFLQGRNRKKNLYYHQRLSSQLTDHLPSIHEENIYLREWLIRGGPREPIPQSPPSLSSKLTQIAFPSLTWRLLSPARLCKYLSMTWQEIVESPVWQRYSQKSVDLYSSFLSAYNPLIWSYAHFSPQEILGAALSPEDINKSLEVRVLFGCSQSAEILQTRGSQGLARMLIASGKVQPQAPLSSTEYLAACFAGTAHLLPAQTWQSYFHISPLDVFFNAWEGYHLHRSASAFLRVVENLPLSPESISLIAEHSTGLPLEIIRHLRQISQNKEFLYQILLKNLGYLITVKWCYALLQGKINLARLRKDLLIEKKYFPRSVGYLEKQMNRDPK